MMNKKSTLGQGRISVLQNEESLPVSLLSCSPKAITGSAEAKKMYIVGANILKLKKKSNT